MFVDFLRFIIGFVLVLLAITFFLYPVDTFIPMFSEIIPMFKGRSLFEYAKQNQTLIYFFIGGSLIFFIAYLAIFK